MLYTWKLPKYSEKPLFDADVKQNIGSLAYITSSLPRNNQAKSLNVTFLLYQSTVLEIKNGNQRKKDASAAVADPQHAFAV